MIQLCTLKGFEDVRKNIFITKDGYVFKMSEDGVRLPLNSSQIHVGGKKERVTTSFIFGSLRFGYKNKARYTTIDKGDRVGYYNVKKYTPSISEKVKSSDKEDDVRILRYYKKTSIEAYNSTCKRILERKGKQYITEVLEAI